MTIGRIVRLYPDKNFGFIHANGDDYFFHGSAVKNAKFRDLNTNQMVEFEPGNSEKGLRTDEVIVKH